MPKTECNNIIIAMTEYVTFKKKILIKYSLNLINWLFKITFLFSSWLKADQNEDNKTLPDSKTAIISKTHLINAILISHSKDIGI